MTEEISSTILKAMPVGYALHRIIWDEAGLPCDYEYLDANGAFETITGLKVSEVIGKRASEVLGDLKRDGIDRLRIYSEVVLNGENAEFEQQCAQSGQCYRVRAFSLGEGRFATMVDDVTAKKALEKGLSDSNQMITELLDSSLDMIFLKDENLRHVYANAALAELSGKTSAELIGKNDFEIYPRECADICQITDREVLSTGRRLLSEERVFGRIFEVMKFPAHYANGTVGIGAFIKDITEDKRREQDLKRQLDRQNILIDVATKGIQEGQDLLDYTMDRGLALTGSQYGHLYLYDGESGQLSLSSWSKGVMRDCAVMDRQTKCALSGAGLWGEAVRQAKPIIINDMSRRGPRRKGFPTGHVALENFMSVPVMIEGRVVAVAGLGNKLGGYSDVDITEMTILLQNAWLTMERKRAQKQTALEREKYRSMLNELPALICELLPDTTLTFVNKSFCTFFDRPMEALIGQKFLDFAPKQIRPKILENLNNLSHNRITGDFELSANMKGADRWVSWRDIGIFDDKGAVLKYYSIGLDVTEQRAFLREKEQLLSRMDAMFRGHEAVMLLIDPQTGKIMDANPSATRFYGYPREELLQMTMREINQLPEEENRSFFHSAINKVQKCFTVPQRLKNGRIRTVDLYCNPITYNDKTMLYAILFDVTEREEAFSQIVHISYHDYLTGVYNRRYFEEQFERVNTWENFPVMVVMGDVNGLKLINDSFGHHEGDSLIHAAASSISEELGGNGVFARIGGDEFGIILPNTDEGQVCRLLSRIKSNIEAASVGVISQKKLLSISFGYAGQKQPGDALGKLMMEAESHMYQKKYYDSRSLKSRTIEIILNALFEKSAVDKLHSERVGNIAAAIAVGLGFNQERTNKVRIAGFLHDIGKIGIPESILNKDGMLTAQEREIMQTHPEKGSRILKNSFEFSGIADIVRYHHERWDGSGYPEGLKGTEIPLESRIISVADAFDAMTFDRSYRKRISSAEAVEELKRCAGAQFDPAIVTAFAERVPADKKDFSLTGAPFTGYLNPV